MPVTSRSAFVIKNATQVNYPFSGTVKNCKRFYSSWAHQGKAGHCVRDVGDEHRWCPRCVFLPGESHHVPTRRRLEQGERVVHLSLDVIQFDHSFKKSKQPQFDNSKAQTWNNHTTLIASLELSEANCFKRGCVFPGGHHRKRMQPFFHPFYGSLGCRSGCTEF